MPYYVKLSSSIKKCLGANVEKGRKGEGKKKAKAWRKNKGQNEKLEKKNERRRMLA